MDIPRSPRALDLAVQRLEDLLDLGSAGVYREDPSGRLDLLLDLGTHTFAVEWRASGGASSVAMAAEQLHRAVDTVGEGVIPVVAVPYMGQVGRERCEKAGVNWLDLSGNARISAPGIRVRIEGKPNQYRRRGRPSSAFAPKASRITRWLLMHPERWVTQRDMAQATMMGEGYTSRVVSRLEDQGLIVRNSEGAVRPRDPDLLLDAWKEDYDFSKHRILRGHIPARSGHELLDKVADRLHAEDLRYAVTGLAAAWLLTEFAGFRLLTVYASGVPQEDVLRLLSIHPEERGANVWLVTPKDDGVLHGASEYRRMQCVHPVQAYLDLLHHPERAREAATELRKQTLNRSELGG